MSDVPVYTRAQVLDEVKRQFGADSVTGIMLLLDEYTSEGGGVERVQMVILKLANGKVNDLKHYLKQAQDDFRDVLYWAEYYDT